jgi:hypothetical protein
VAYHTLNLLLKGYHIETEDLKRMNDFVMNFDGKKVILLNWLVELDKH